MDETELRQELLAAFEAEYREHLGAMRAALDAGTVSGATLRDVFRRAHSLKGAARAVELPEVEAIAHGLETLLYGAVEAEGALPADAVATVARDLDSIEARMRGAEAAPPAATTPGDATADDATADDAAPAHAATPQPSVDQALLRVQASEIDRLGEAVHALSEAMQAGERSRALLARTEAELRALVRLSGTAVQDGELDRRLRALSRQVSAEQRSGAARDWQLDQAAQAVRGQLERVTLVSADGVFEPLAAMARELAREGGAEVVVHLSGLALRAERRVLQALRDPAIQMLRNAVGHGLRRAAARDGDAPAAAEIGLSLRSRRGRLELAVTDNGPGPDLPAIAGMARARGLLGPDAPVPDEARLLSLVFEPGFSTATAVDRLSGRGMGLSIVAEAAHRLRGTARMRCRRDPSGRVCGTELRVSVPLAARRQVLLLVEAGGHLFGLPAAAVTRLLRVPAAAVQRLEARPFARLPDRVLPDRVLPDRVLPDRLLELGALARLLGGVDPLRDPEPGTPLPVAVLSGADGRFGLVVERLCEVRSLVVRAPELVGLDRELVAGVALVENDRPVPVLEPDALVARLRAASPSAQAQAQAQAQAPVQARARPEAARTQATILVVDDSITTRTLEKTILQAQGYRVLIAVDGMEALGMLRTAQWEVDVVVADVEMPRLDGFGLLAAMNADPRLRGIPTVLMTSRSAESDVKRGLELGARAYIAKQEFDQGRLLATIGQLLP